MRAHGLEIHGTEILALNDAETLGVGTGNGTNGRLRPAATGVQFSANGTDWSGILEDNESAPAGTDVLGYNGYLYATRVYNAVWNDIADFRYVLETVETKPGLCYLESGIGATYCSKRCQKGVIGILTDTYGVSAGSAPGKVPFSVAGWVLAYVDKQYEPGTCLTNAKDGTLTKIKWWEKILYPERILATYCGKEKEEFWGNKEEKIFVDGRHWVKVK